MISKTINLPFKDLYQDNADKDNDKNYNEYSSVNAGAKNITDQFTA